MDMANLELHVILGLKIAPINHQNHQIGFDLLIVYTWNNIATNCNNRNIEQMNDSLMLLKRIKEYFGSDKTDCIEVDNDNRLTNRIKKCIICGRRKSYLMIL